jgi:hypothetical protein
MSKMCNIKVGDRVKVVDLGRVYTTYQQFADRNNLTRFIAREGRSPKKGKIYVVTAVSNTSSDRTLLGISTARNDYIIDTLGVQRVDR